MNNPAQTARCPVCPRHCALAEGQTGFCRARIAQNGQVVAQNYGRATALALDPIEKKPLYHFHPGSRILSVGSYGCNLRCPFCQNHDISQRGPAQESILSPEALVQLALNARGQGNIGIAFTYNEPAVGWEYVRDAARLAAKEHLAPALVTNGWFCAPVRKALLPLIAAFNIDLKCFTEEGYRRLGGSLAPVMNTIAAVAAHPGTHLEVTWLVVPGLSDDEEDMQRAAAWLASLSPDIPLHLSRYFPRWHADAPATPPPTLHRLAAIAKQHLRHVYGPF
ncbi:AmmeMemoRadiSam system radical SAM enzyme [Ruminococcaceae bacterium OttesenSCG-928-O06]|nr:AmmeMemoRadiSam system radical SAM enzyme [Ruminococcaceae bacterium OttesenSCG-928-O06]